MSESETEGKVEYGYLLARVRGRLQELEWRILITLALIALTLTVLLTAAVGISRIYLGLHWPTDVIAGWLAGVSWALAVLLIADFWN